MTRTARIPSQAGRIAMVMCSAAQAIRCRRFVPTSRQKPVP